MRSNRDMIAAQTEKVNKALEAEMAVAVQNENELEKLTSVIKEYDDQINDKAKTLELICTEGTNNCVTSEAINEKVTAIHHQKMTQSHLDKNYMYEAKMFFEENPFSEITVLQRANTEY